MKKTTEVTLNNYPELLQQIQKEIKQTEDKITKGIIRGKVVMAWNIGKVIGEHLLQNDRADYGKKLFEQLSADILIVKRTLYQMRNFYKTYPKLPQGTVQK